MIKYSARFAATPWGMAVSWQDLIPDDHPPTHFEWQYRFQDGSRLVGQVEVPSALDASNLLHPRQLQAVYIGTDGKTVLLQWQKQDFVIFETTQENLIIASNDNFVGNSMSLVSCPSRSSAQVTHWGSKLVSESFNPESWSFQAIAAENSRYQVSWQLSSFFPFFGYSLHWQPSPDQINWPMRCASVWVSPLQTTLKNCNDRLQLEKISL